MVSPTIVIPPTVWPVSLEEAKAQCRVTGADDDAELQDIIEEATVYVENQLGISLSPRTYLLTLDAFYDVIELTRGPVQSVTMVQYVDEGGDTQVLSTDAYDVDLNKSWAGIVRKSDASWPTTLNAINAVSITYVAGFEQLPFDYLDIRRAIKIAIQRLFERHADPRNDEAMRKAFEDLLWNHRKMTL